MHDSHQHSISGLGLLRTLAVGLTIGSLAGCNDTPAPKHEFGGPTIFGLIMLDAQGERTIFTARPGGTEFGIAGKIFLPGEAAEMVVMRSAPIGNPQSISTERRVTLQPIAGNPEHYEFQSQMGTTEKSGATLVTVQIGDATGEFVIRASPTGPPTPPR